MRDDEEGRRGEGKIGGRRENDKTCAILAADTWAFACASTWRAPKARGCGTAGDEKLLAHPHPQGHQEGAKRAKIGLYWIP